jgi:GT2 family glycosyltransferase
LQTAPDFSVLIVNYNGGTYVQGALDSLKAQTHRSFEVILLDNASADGSVDALDTGGLPAFTLMRETENHGFARGNNLAAAQAKGRWLALLNPDAAARPDWLAQVMAGTKRHPGVTSFACTQLWMHDETKLDGAGDNYLIFGIPWRGGYHRPVSDLPAEGTCFSPCGASAVYLRETFATAGGFDERLFCFCEDVDLGFRLRLEGGDCVFLPDAAVSHAGGHQGQQPIRGDHQHQHREVAAMNPGGDVPGQAGRPQPGDHDRRGHPGRGSGDPHAFARHQPRTRLGIGSGWGI